MVQGDPGIDEPLYIDGISFDQESGELRINTDFRRCARFAAEAVKVYLAEKFGEPNRRAEREAKDAMLRRSENC